MSNRITPIGVLQRELEITRIKWNEIYEDGSILKNTKKILLCKLQEKKDSLNHSIRILKMAKSLTHEKK